MISTRRLNQSSLSVEIASNDGYLLQFYHRHDIPVLGIEPAVNVARIAQEERGIRTLCEFFGNDLARKLKREGTEADVIHANNVLAHVADLNGFAAGIKLLLKKNGTAVIEVPYVKDLIDHCEFDTIYHEHLCYFSLIALNNLFQRHALNIQNVKRIPIHGGSLRVFVGKDESRDGTGEVRRMIEDEVRLGTDRLEFYK